MHRLTGVNFIFYYGTSFFTAKGIALPFITTVITDVVNVVSTLPGLYGVEVFGRRALLFWGSIGMLACQFIVAAVGSTTNTPAGDKAFVAFICIYIFFFASTWGPLAWVVSNSHDTGRHEPANSCTGNRRDLSSGSPREMLVNDHGEQLVLEFHHWLCHSLPGSTPLLAVLEEFLLISTGQRWAWQCQPSVESVLYLGILLHSMRHFRVYLDLRDQGLSLIVASIPFLTWFQGLSLEQVDEMYAKVPHAWNSYDFVPTVSFQEVQAVQGDTNARSQSLADVEAVAERKRSIAPANGGTDRGFLEKQ